MHLILFNWLYCCCWTLQSPQTSGHLPFARKHSSCSGIELITSSGSYLIFLSLADWRRLPLDTDLCTAGGRHLTLSQGKRWSHYRWPQCFIWKLWSRLHGAHVPSWMSGTLSLVCCLGNVPALLSHPNPPLLPAALAFQSLAWLYFHFWWTQGGSQAQGIICGSKTFLIWSIRREPSRVIFSGMRLSGE